MAFCGDCGKETVVGAKFCRYCGGIVAVTTKTTVNQRQQEYIGKVYKCPNCGEALKSFVTNCPACGLELRGAKATNSVRELALKLEAIESRREYQNPRLNTRSIFTKAGDDSGQLLKTDEQKVNLIRSFSIPNTKEDIYEFIILAQSNINIRLHEKSNLRENDPRKAISDAWEAKFEQAYQKAQISFQNEADFVEIEYLYEKTTAKIKNARRKDAKVLIVTLSIMILSLIIMFSIRSITEPQRTSNEISRIEAETARMEAIVVEINDALENGEFKLAFINAKTLIYDEDIYSKTDDEAKRRWDVQREYLIGKIIEDAEKVGITLSYESSVDESVDENSDSSFSSGFAEGFNSGISEGLDAAQESIDEFNEIMSRNKHVVKN